MCGLCRHMGVQAEAWDHHDMTLARGAQATQSCAMILEWCCLSPEARVPRA